MRDKCLMWCEYRWRIRAGGHGEPEPVWLSGGPDSGKAPVLGLIAVNMVERAFFVGTRSFVETNCVGTAIPMSPGQTALPKSSDAGETGLADILPIPLRSIDDYWTSDSQRGVVRPACDEISVLILESERTLLPGEG